MTRKSISKAISVLAVFIITALFFSLSSCYFALERENKDDPGRDDYVSAHPVLSSTALTISNINSNSFSVNWEKASDDDTKEADLEYRVVYSSSDNISTLEAADATRDAGTDTD